MPYPRLSDDVVAQCFPLVRPTAIRPGAFELGLCLGGTVSAGAYTAGVLDFLIEALDSWTRAKDDKSPDAPLHDIVISTLAGASGGAINGAILLRGAGWEFDHGASDDNPFYTAWTGGVDLMKLLAPAHNETKLVSLFNTEAIETQVKKSIAYTGRKLGSTGSPRRRSYLADPLRLITTVGNVTGVPYSMAFTGESGLGHDLVAHADWMRFALSVPGGVQADPPMRPDELALCSDPSSPQNWDIVGNATLATSAFPLAFCSRPLSRLMERCRYRVEAVPGMAGPGSGSVVELLPRWDTLEHGEHDPSIYNFVNVDGGTTNNQPLDMVRIALSGLDGRNPRDPQEADRAVILIDPFCDPLQLGPTLPPPLAGLLIPFVMSLVYQARYKPADIALAYDESKYSRYLITPVGPGADNQTVIGQAAIASGGLGGFLGFLDPAFMRYDFVLGRLNAYRFLKQHFALPEAANNPIFASWTADQRNKYRFTDLTAAGQPLTDYLPLIPLMDSVQRPTLPEWPKVSDLPAGIADAIDARLNAVFALAQAAAAPASRWKGTLQATGLSVVWSFVRPRLRDYALAALRQGLIDQKLMPTT